MRIGPGLVFVLFCVFVSTARADQPQITITADQEEVTVGQPYMLRLEVLVPTFMPRAPVFPSFEMPGLVVRLPERSTSPISKRIDGETWAGVQRTYRIYPMREGVTEIPPQQVSIVYKDVATNTDVALSLDVPAMQIRAIVPPEARNLDPLILANDLSIEQTWEVADGTLAIGDAVVRTLEVSVAGTSALFVPPLLEQANPQPASVVEGQEIETAAFLPYPEDPRVTETMTRGVMSGTRTETISYIAQSGGSATFEEISLRWFNLSTNKVEDITLEGRIVMVASPPYVRPPLDRGAIARLVAVLIAIFGAIWIVYRLAWPKIRQALLRLSAAYQASARAAHRKAEKCVASHDLNGLITALALRTSRGCPPSEPLRRALNDVTRATYRDGKTATAAASEWRNLRLALKADRSRLRARDRRADTSGLASLNPM